MTVSSLDRLADKSCYPQECNVSRDYAATLLIAVKKRLFEPLGPEKIPKGSVLEADSSNRRHDSINFHEFVNRSV
jgi:hypothetical protein